MAYEEARHLMVVEQLRARGVTDKRVLDAMDAVPRHLFVDDHLKGRAYNDCALPIGESQTISQPYMVALMTELLGLTGDEKVLEIGTGSGYQSAVLSLLASSVYTVERIHPLAEKAKELLDELEYNNVHIFKSDGSLGLKEHAPYDAIIVTAAAPEISQTYIDQLKVDGVLVIPAGSRYSQVLYKVKKTGSGTEKSISTSCIFVPLLGKEGWDEE
jgi:protein-L-isoaspartate(D-aspartate) O-methyltransferase